MQNMILIWENVSQRREKKTKMNRKKSIRNHPLSAAK